MLCQISKAQPICWAMSLSAERRRSLARVNSMSQSKNLLPKQFVQALLFHSSQLDVVGLPNFPQLCRATAGTRVPTGTRALDIRHRDLRFGPFAYKPRDQTPNYGVSCGAVIREVVGLSVRRRCALRCV